MMSEENRGNSCRCPKHPEYLVGNPGEFRSRSNDIAMMSEESRREASRYPKYSVEYLNGRRERLPL
jgi:hypothetical protein